MDSSVMLRATTRNFFQGLLTRWQHANCLMLGGNAGFDREGGMCGCLLQGVGERSIARARQRAEHMYASGDPFLADESEEAVGAGTILLAERAETIDETACSTSKSRTTPTSRTYWNIRRSDRNRLVVTRKWWRSSADQLRLTQLMASYV